MSDEEKPLEFSARDLMPDWAQDKPRDTPQDYAKRFGDDDRRERRGGGGRRDDRRGGGRGEDRRGGFGGRGEKRDFRERGDRPRGDRPQGDRRDGDRRGNRPGPGREGRGGDRRGGDRRGGHGREEFSREDRAAAGVVASLEPSGPAIEGLTRHIRETFRSFPLADLAKMILEARERYRVRFTATEPVRLHQCLADGSLWLNREEAVSHLLSGPALEHYYTPEDLTVDAPAGNFAVIAVCGMSGVILGPPNHHEYQRNIARLHRERFSDMPIERFKSRIRMESGEEILEKWKEQVSRVRHYRVKSAEQPSSVADEDPSEEVPADEVSAVEDPVAAEAPEAEAGEETPEPIETEVEEATPEAVETEEVSAEAAEEAPAEEETPEPVEAAPAPAKESEGPVLKNLEEVSRHFREHFADGAIVETAVAVVPGNIAGKLLSPGLLAHLRQETEKLRRGFPLPMIQSLCNEFERQGLKFFKRGKKSLHVAAIRPKAIDENVSLTDAIQVIVNYVRETPTATVAGLLEALVPGFKKPEGPALEESPEWSDAARAVLNDLRWLTAEGYVLEFPDTGLAIGRETTKEPASATPEAPKAKQEKPAKKRKTRAADESAAAAVAPAVVEAAEAPAAVEATDVPAVVDEAEAPVEVEATEASVEGEATDAPVDLDLDPEDLSGLPPHTLTEDKADPDDPHEMPDDVDPAQVL